MYIIPLYFGIGLEWIFGTINIGWMRPEFIQDNAVQKQRVIEQASELGLTYHQQKLRWGW